MATHTRRYVVCDMCLDANPDKEVEGEIIAMYGRNYHPCPKHKLKVEEVRAFIRQFGHLPNEKAPRASEESGSPRVVCGDCEDDVAWTSKTYHAKNKHGKSSRDIQWTSAAA